MISVNTNVDSLIFLSGLNYTFFILTLNLVLTQTVVLKVGMSCQGCVGAVKRVLGKLEGWCRNYGLCFSFYYICYCAVIASMSIMFANNFFFFFVKNALRFSAHFSWAENSSKSCHCLKSHLFLCLSLLLLSKLNLIFPNRSMLFISSYFWFL